MNRPLHSMLTAWALAGLLFGCGSDTQKQTPTQDTVAEDSTSQETAGQEDVVVPPDAALDLAETVQPPEYEPVVFAVVSDLHVNGPFEATIPRNVVQLLADAAAKDPKPEFIAVTGDLTDTLFEPVDLGPGSRIDSLKQVLGSSTLPVEAVLGNHDYYKQDNPQFLLVDDQQTRDQLFLDQFSIQPYYFTTHGGMKFIYLNTMQGDLWNISMGLNGSAGAQQLEWLDQTLSDGVPAILFMHHPPSTVLEEGEMTVSSVMAAHSENVLAVFCGHVHLWVRSVQDGVPVYLTKAGYDGEGIHHVRVDPNAGTVEILNEEEIDYGEPIQPDCDPEAEPPLTAPAAVQGTYLELLISDATAEPAGFGTYLEEAVKMIPFVFKMGAVDPSGLAISAHLAMGAWVGSGPLSPKYVAALTDGPCLQVGFLLDSPCFETSPVSLTFDLAKSLGIALPAGHQIRVTLKDLSFYGALTDTPSISKGLMHAKVDLNPGVEDLQNLLVEQYCAGKIGTCQPGVDTMPACAAPIPEDFFTKIPTKCDVKIGSIGIRMVLGMMKTVPGYVATMDAHYTTYKATESQTSATGAVDPDLFYCEAD